MHANKHGVKWGRSKPRQCANRQCLAYLRKEGKDFRFTELPDTFGDRIRVPSLPQQVTKPKGRQPTMDQLIDKWAMTDLDPSGSGTQGSKKEDDENEWNLVDENAARLMLGMKPLTREEWEKQGKKVGLWR